MAADRFVHPPISRHPSLRPLSREHMSGLVLVRRLRSAADDPEADARLIGPMLRGVWEGELRPHFADEESMLGALISDRDRARLIEEHRSLERRILMAIDAPARPSPEWLRETADLLEQHIRWEERVLFPEAERTGPEALNAMAAEAARIERERPGSRPR